MQAADYLLFFPPFGQIYLLLLQSIDFRLEIIRTIVLIILLLISQVGVTEKLRQFDNFELRYNVVNATFLSPFVAEKYGITRGERHAILNLSLRELSVEGSDCWHGIIRTNMGFDSKSGFKFHYDKRNEGCLLLS